MAWATVSGNSAISSMAPGVLYVRVIPPAPARYGYPPAPENGGYPALRLLPVPHG